MIIDKFLQLSDKQTVSATAPSTHEVDFGQPTPMATSGRLQPHRLMTTISAQICR